MSKELQDGLIIDNGFLIVDEKKPGFPITSRVFQFFAIFLGGWGSISVLVESLSIPVRLPVINLTIFLTASLLFLLCLIPSHDIIKQFFLALFYGLFLYSRFSALQNGFYILENLVLQKMSSYYGFQNISFIADYKTAEQDTTLLIAMIAIPIVSLLAVAVVRSRYINICSLVLFIPVSISFLVGIIPPEKYLLAYVAAVLYLTHSGYSLRHIINKEQKDLLHRISSRTAVWLSLLCIGLFLILKLFVSEKDYENIEEIKTAKSQLQKMLYEFSVEDVAQELKEIRLFDRNTGVGGLDGGKLGKVGEVTFQGADQLLVTAPSASFGEGIYLKGYVGSVYTGSSWDEHTKADRNKYKELLNNMSDKEFVPVNQVFNLINRMTANPMANPWSNLPTTSRFQVYQGNLKVEYKGANEKFIYAPYFTNYEILNKTYYVQDLYAAPENRKSSYNFTYYFNLSLTDTPLSLSWMQDPASSYSEDEKQYRKYVHEVYTKLPEEGLNRLKEEFVGANASAGVVEKIEFVQSYLARNARYTLAPGKLPKNEDFVEYFLFENKLGYCAHFASAGALMLRAMGVPARYVEGYALGPNQSADPMGSAYPISAYTESGEYRYTVQMSEVIVKDYNAHAWVEVYIDGCGWIPVEFTPGSSIEFNTAIIEELERDDENSAIVPPEDETVPNEEQKPTKAPNKPTPKPEEENSLENMEPNPHSVSSNQKDEEAERMDRLFILIFILLCVVFIPFIFFLRYQRLRRLRMDRNINKRAIYLFAEVEKLIAFCKGLPEKAARLEDHEDYVKENCLRVEPEAFSHCMETARRARFGRGSITYHDLRAVENFHRNLYEDVYREQSLGKKLLLKLLFQI